VDAAEAARRPRRGEQKNGKPRKQPDKRAKRTGQRGIIANAETDPESIVSAILDADKWRRRNS
jgi:hypothetical protein